ncbi:beta-1,4-N-acetylgalactosamyltransferase [Helicobacter kayseriensis]|uniref:beta-1,4-N-acetylgalactosamyltransferase n=1 Tax=Helicobacter kayseriensis TaxID=2905877 RepID=UPI001E65C97B|nr:beta-1,4-N-acetylgalactosamyltransferase [Helicobacter kayseriensis]MCE3047471.1 beta-1,4-N-acetylgalactosamyltransferase [Helicobacter kayseriensis]MCE3048796.1 beta-1,4-N-acetylgalactosamyltransferase [Helicobacter kayseriensis]
MKKIYAYLKRKFGPNFVGIPLNQAVLQDPNHLQSPLNPWAFIRVKDEFLTLQKSLDSILGAIKRGVIVYHECMDDSEQIILNFCTKNPDFICVRYPYAVLQNVHTDKEREAQDRHKMYEYYNFALNLIPKNQWLIKIDADQIYDAQKLKESFSLVQYQNDVVFYCRINLHLEGKRLLLIKNSPISDVDDHWLIFNQDLSFVDHIHSIENQNGNKIFHTWEFLSIGFSFRAIQAPLVTWHFPQMKARRNIDQTSLIPFSQYRSVIPQEFISKRIPLDMLEEKRILSYWFGEEGGRDLIPAHNF